MWSWLKAASSGSEVCIDLASVAEVVVWFWRSLNLSVGVVCPQFFFSFFHHGGFPFLWDHLFAVSDVKHAQSNQSMRRIYQSHPNLERAV